MKTVTLSDGSEFTYEIDVDVELIEKISKLPYPKLRKLVSLGGVTFYRTPTRFDLESVLDEIDQTELKKLYIQLTK
jgi:hypothetical protein